MRVRLTFSTDGPSDLKIPLNYNVWLVSAIYRWLGLSSRDYADFLHSEGYRLDGRPYKLFCFSQLFLRDREIHGDFVFSSHGGFSWLLSSAKTEFTTHLTQGIERDPGINLAGHRSVVRNIEDVIEPELRPPVKFTCLSPITASIWDEESEANPIRYLTPGEEFTEAVASNLRRKFVLVNGHAPDEERFSMTFDQHYMARRRSVTKLLDFKGIKVRGVLCPFVAEGSSELMQVGYQCGFGEKNSTGFGMVEALE